MLAGDVAGLESDAVVGDLEPGDARRATSQRTMTCVAPRVAVDVRERFLPDAPDLLLDPVRERHRRVGQPTSS